MSEKRARRFAAPNGWAVLRADVNSRLRQARRRKREAITLNLKYLEGRAAGQIAELVEIRKTCIREMKITLKAIPQMTIEEFAEKNELEMEIHEHPRPVGDPSRYYAHFRRAEVKDGGMLIGSYGNGATPELAIENYAPKISLKRLVIDAYSEQRRELEVPRLARAVGGGISDDAT